MGPRIDLNKRRVGPSRFELEIFAILTANNPNGFFSTSGNQRFPSSLMTIVICVCHLRMSRRRPNQLDHEPNTKLTSIGKEETQSISSGPRNNNISCCVPHTEAQRNVISLHVTHVFRIILLVSTLDINTVDILFPCGSCGFWKYIIFYTKHIYILMLFSV